MRAKGLIDTGALLALLTADDRWHERCRDAFANARLPLATTSAVIAEMFYFLLRCGGSASPGWKLLRSGAVRVLPITDADSADLEHLMEKYADRPMDYADATLVWLAERESLSTILTIDHNDFETYRIGAKKRFRVVPAR